MWLDKVILFTSRKKSWNETFFDMSDRRQFIQIKASLLLDRLLHEGHGGADEELGHLGVRCSQLVTQSPKV